MLLLYINNNVRDHHTRLASSSIEIFFNYFPCNLTKLERLKKRVKQAIEYRNVVRLSWWRWWWL